MITSTGPVAAESRFHQLRRAGSKSICAVVAAVTLVLLIAFMAGKMNPSQMMLFMVPVPARAPQGSQAPVASVKEILTGMQPVRNSIGMAVPEAQANREIMNALGKYEKCESYCCRRNMLAQAVGAAAITLGAPALAAESKMVLMGTDVGLAFEPKETTVCKGDSVTWKNNRLGPHNVVFNPDDVPSGVDASAISTPEYIGGEGETYTVKFDKATGDYGYYCEPHQGAGMIGLVTVMS
mmetsp:Transcript_44287/g.77142  ORF Transcript_44287/g.77142 Transcript_44287/m.77142 type:complete len:238 (-) Transcript_44287:187-900(-)